MYKKNGFPKVMKVRKEVSCLFFLLLVLSSCEETNEEQTANNDTSVYWSIVSGKQIPVPFVGRDCADLYLSGYKVSGIYSIRPVNWDVKFNVYCDMHTDQGGWTVFQRRGDYQGSPEDYFLRNWTEYKNGFGYLSKEFWLGNERIHALTQQGAYQLRADLWDADEKYAFAKYGRFWIGNETDLYRLYIGGYSGDAGDSMKLHHLNQFVAKDRDVNDCVFKRFKGAWWSSKICPNAGWANHANLNGMNLKGPTTSSSDAIIWYHWRNLQYSLSFTELKVRPREFLRLI